MSTTVRVVHFSDWHGQWSPLPKADLYICTGDMLPNYPDIVKSSHTWSGYDRIISSDKEARLQTQWLESVVKLGSLRKKFLQNRGAPVVVVRGNHDFVDLGPWFGGEVFEINEDPTRTVEYCGLRIGGFRGIPYISGEWADEYEEQDLDAIIAQVPINDLDVMVSHAPPSGILADKYGSVLWTWKLNKSLYAEERLPSLFCFGHIHNACGTLEWDDGTVFSNAATTKNTIDLEIHETA